MGTIALSKLVVRNMMRDKATTIRDGVTRDGGEKKRADELKISQKEVEGKEGGVKRRIIFLGSAVSGGGERGQTVYAATKVRPLSLSLCVCVCVCEILSSDVRALGRFVWILCHTRERGKMPSPLSSLPPSLLLVFIQRMIRWIAML